MATVFRSTLSHADSKRPSAVLARLADYAVVGPPLFAILLLVQDVIEWDWLTRMGWNPISEAPVSDLAWTPIGAVQILNFLLVGTSTLALAFLFHRTVARNRFTYAALAVLVLIGAAFTASGARCDCYSATVHFSNPASLAVLGRIHTAAFFGVALPSTFGPILVWARLRRDLRFRAAARHSLIQAVIMLPLLVATLSGPIEHASLFYVWLLAVLSWLTHLAIAIRRVLPDRHPSTT